MHLGIVLVDHGSRLAESNELLVRVAEAFGKRFWGRYPIVEPAHMEIARPTIAEAYGRCVERGAEMVIVVPYFLGPGKHWTEDIPRLAAEAAKQFPGTRYQVTPYLGIDDLMLDLLGKRISESLAEGA
jgi:sirohydrochlorin ferrochelatase